MDLVDLLRGVEHFDVIVDPVRLLKTFQGEINVYRLAPDKLFWDTRMVAKNVSLEEGVRVFVEELQKKTHE